MMTPLSDIFPRAYVPNRQCAIVRSCSYPTKCCMKNCCYEGRKRLKRRYKDDSDKNIDGTVCR
jgi:hypothetical protein